ncbi:MAG: hypothetical protein ABJA66_17065, partial [Actinomycetota bacterium]
MKLFSVLFIAFVLFVLAFDASAQNYSYLDDKAIEGKVARLLQKRDVSELANELARDKSAATEEDLLVKLSVFARAGHRARVQETLREISKIFSVSPNQNQIFHVVRRAVSDDDLPAQKIFYEEFAPNGDDRVGYFITAWREKGEAGELEKWLKARAQINETWWNLLVNLKQSLGTANEITDELAQKIWENPADYSLVQKYLRASASQINVSVSFNSPINSDARYEQDVAWLADVVKTDTAYESFDLAIQLRQSNPLIAVKLLNKSLSLAFTETDAKLFGESRFRGASISANVKNPEKQLRVWTKKALVEIYQETNQARLAQTIVEELTAMDMSDIQPDNAFYNAGAVQSVTGLRVVEAKLLKDEKEGENSPDYWINRAAYYAGRKENALVWKTYLQALDKFPYKPNDLQASFPRLEILYEVGWRGSEGKETVKILRKEFTKAKANNDSKYLYHLLRIINDELDDLRDVFAVNTDLLPQVLATRKDWSVDERNLIGNLMESEKWDKQKRDTVWDKLSELAKRDVANRAYYLAEAMTSENEDRKAIPLLEECLKIAPEESDGVLHFNREDIESDLFDIYIVLGDWQKAEKLYSDDLDYG